MDRLIQTIKSVTKSEGISVKPLSCPKCGSGELKFIKDDLCQCEYCGVLSSIVDGKLVAGIDESNEKNIKEKLTEEAMKPIVDALNDGTRETQTIVSVDENKNDRPTLVELTMYLIISVLMILYGDIMGKKEVLAIVCKWLGYGGLPLATFGIVNTLSDRKKVSENESTDTEEVVRKNGGM